MIGAILREHPLALYHDRLNNRGVLSSVDLLGCLPGSLVRVAGLAVVYQALPTAKGYHFITLKDEKGLINPVVRPNIYPKHDITFRTQRLLAVDGEVKRQGAVANVLL